MKKMLLGLSLVALSVASGPAVFAQDLQKALAAYEAGDFTTALKEWKLLAEQGDVLAQNIIGGMYYKGEGVLQNYAEAVKWYRLSAEQGYVDAQNTLGLMYREGQGVPQDYNEAVKWYRMAAEQGYALAQNNLGLMYEYGPGGPQSKVMAHMWYNIASANGASEAGKWRDELADEMTNDDISKAQTMARECMNSDYENCAW